MKTILEQVKMYEESWGCKARLQYFFHAAADMLEITIELL